MPSEIDPLLPRVEPSPEITGNGYSKANSQWEILDAAPPADDADQDDARSALFTTSARSALNTIISFFTVLVLFIFLIILLSPNTIDWKPHPYPNPKPPPDQSTIAERVSDILNRTPLIDGHNDLAFFLRGYYKNHIHTSKFADKFENGGMEADVDLPRLRIGKVGGSFWSAFVPCPNNASEDFSDQNYTPATSMTLSQIDLIRRLQQYYPSIFTPATTPLGSALTAFHENYKLISPISIEGLHQVPQSAPMSTLRLYHALGVRAASLTWNCHNAFADAALISSDGITTVAPYHRGGLTTLGRAVLRELNRLGILIDLSHTSYWTQKAVLSNSTSLAPVIFSHSSAFALCPHPRNVHDDILNLVKETNSLVMINFVPNFISCLPPPSPSVLPELYKPNNTLHQVARHIVYVGEKIGYAHVGLGSDFDGMGEPPSGLNGVDKFPDLVAELLKMGVSDVDAGNVVGGNLLRVWKEADEVAGKMARDGVLEGEDEVKGWDV